MNKVLILLVALTTTGCGDTSELNIAKAHYLCQEHSGVYSLKSISGLTCCDSTHITWESVHNAKLPVDKVTYYFKLNNKEGSSVCVN